MSRSDVSSSSSIVRRAPDRFRAELPLLIHHSDDNLIKPNMSRLEVAAHKFRFVWQPELSFAISIFASQKFSSRNEEIHPTNWHSIIYGRDEISWQLHQHSLTAPPAMNMHSRGFVFLPLRWRKPCSYIYTTIKNIYLTSSRCKSLLDMSEMKILLSFFAWCAEQIIYDDFKPCFGIQLRRALSLGSTIDTFHSMRVFNLRNMFIESHLRG